jgi:hypothetical protein
MVNSKASPALRAGGSAAWAMEKESKQMIRDSAFFLGVSGGELAFVLCVTFVPFVVNLTTEAQRTQRFHKEYFTLFVVRWQVGVFAIRAATVRWRKNKEPQVERYSAQLAGEDNPSFAALHLGLFGKMCNARGRNLPVAALITL